MTIKHYTGPDGFSATIEENADGTFTLTATPTPDHRDVEICGSLQVAEAEIRVRCPAAAEVEP